MVSASWLSIEIVSFYSFIILIILLTVGGNLVVLFAFYNDPHLLTPSNNFLLSMAIADLLVGLIAMPFYSFAQLKGFWPFGGLFCKIWLTIDDVATMASVLSIVAITIERYWSINHSVHYRRHTTKTRIRIFSVLIWLIPLINFAPGIWLLDPIDTIPTTNITKKSNPECIGAYHSHTIYLIVAQINFFAWPLVVILILNALIVGSLYRRSHRFPTLNNSLEQRKDNGLQDIKLDKNDERQNRHEHTIENDEGTISNSNDNHCQTYKNDGEAHNHDHFGTMIPPVIKEVEEPLVEDEVIASQPSQSNHISSSNETETRPSASRFYIRIKKVLLSSSTPDECQSSKSTQTLHRQQQRQKRESQSIFTWRYNSFRLSKRNMTSNSGEQRTVRRLRRDKRAATSLLILVLVFMIFLLPYVVVVVAGSIFSLEILTDTNGQLYSAAFWLLWLNSTVNPILYPFIQPKFRDAYRRIFLRIIRRRRRLASLIADMQRNK
ncbi:hypothetical protein I4U23_020865 [Adineta vaga]|nr:hypothetical protein I4U23_020865 [Adineta vaga]